MTSSRPKLAVPRYSPTLLLLALAALIFSLPLVEDLPHGAFWEGLLLTAVLLSSLFALAGGRSILLGSLLAAGALAGQWIGFFFPAITPLAALPQIAFAAFIVLRLLSHILHAKHVDHGTICAALSGFMMIGVLWAIMYSALGHWNPSVFSFSQPHQIMDGFNAFYFSFVTLSTLGFGDIIPVSRFARMLTVMEAVTGMFYMAVLISRLVSIHSSKTASE